MYNDNDKSYRNTYLIERIERNIEKDKKSVAKDTALLGASALAVGIGALGIAFLGDDVINAFTSGDALTVGSYMLVRFQGAGVAISATSVIGGIVAAVNNTKNAISSFKKLKDDKNRLEEEKGRSR